MNNVNSLSKNEVLKKYEHYLSDDFEACVTKKVKLPLKENVKPVFCKARPVPLRLRDRVRDELTRLENLGIISRTVSSEWSSPMVSVVKSNDEIRVCGDYSVSLNKHLEHSDFPLPSVEEIMEKVHNSGY